MQLQSLTIRFALHIKNYQQSTDFDSMERKSLTIQLAPINKITNRAQILI